jgi:hypothetical protein
MSSYNNEEDFETNDIYLAAYLKISGCDYDRRRREGARVFFVFSNKAGSVLDMREAYFAGKGKVVASAYAQELRNFKELCYK